MSFNEILKDEIRQYRIEGRHLDELCDKWYLNQSFEHAYQSQI